jgi:hypothetical protein
MTRDITIAISISITLAIAKVAGKARNFSRR